MISGRRQAASQLDDLLESLEGERLGGDRGGKAPSLGDQRGATEKDLEPVDHHREVTWRDEHKRLVGDAAVSQHDPLRRPQVGAELRDRLVDGLDSAVADLGLADGGMVGTVLDVGRRGAGTVRLASPPSRLVAPGP